MRPSLHETVLVEWGFKSLLAEILSDETAYGFRIGATHSGMVLGIREMLQPFFVQCHYPLAHVIQLVVACCRCKDAVEVSPVDISDEYLSEGVA